MRVKRLTTWLVLGVAVALAYSVRRRRGAPHRRAVPTAPSARPVGPWGTPAAIDPTVLGRGDEAGDVFGERIAEPLSDDVAAYGDRRASLGPLPDDDEAQAEGENWLEHLQASSAELGPEPEHAIDVVDDSDPHAGHHKTETRDTPVADHGAAGPRGL